ncbi:MAG: adenylate/guanylate cyclase protein [Rhizobacter sp.]|nr:adenylate/guanylate cyclase protein [Rhizobacter sp.]
MFRHLLAMRWGLAVPLASIAAGALVLLADPVPLQVLRNAGFDQYQRWKPREASDAPVRIVDIDDESLRRLGQWPWPRTQVAELTRRLQAAGASAIVFDMVFAEPDRTSPAAMLASWQAPAALRQALAAMPDHDQALADAIAQGRVVLGFSLTRDHEESDSGGAAPTKLSSRARFISIGEPPDPFLHAFSAAVPNLPLLQAAAAGNGAMTFVPDVDGVVRKVPLVVTQHGRLVPSLVTEALRVAQGARNVTLRSSTQPGVGPQEMRIGSLSVHTTPHGEAWVHYSRPLAQRYVPAWKVLAGELPADALQGRIVLVGTSAQGLMDLRFSPLASVIPGVEVHAQFLEQVLSGQSLDRPAWAGAIEATMLVAGGLLAAVITLATGALVSSIAVAALLAAWAGFAWNAFAAHGLLIDAASPALAVAITFVLTSIVRHLSSERRQRWVKQAFSRYVSPNLVHYLVEHPEALELGGRRQVCSFVFTDLAGFTSLMEGMDPARAVELLNDYLDRMIAIAFEHEGTLDRIVGDAVAIMFSAPLPQADHRERALACGLAMQRFATQYVLDVQAAGGRFCATRVGIHTGEVIVGNFGGSHMFDYRALGDAVNTAARLEGANKHLGTLVCVSEATLEGCPGAPARPIGRLLLKGKSHPLKVFEPIDAGEPASAVVPVDAATIASYMQGYEAMAAGSTEQALAAFERLAAECPGDGLVAFQLQRLRNGQSGELIVLESK